MNGADVVWNPDGTSTTVKETWDGGVKLSDPGLTKTPPPTYLTADTHDAYADSVTFTAFVDITKFSTLGVRATSTSTAEGSIKWVDETPSNPSAPPTAGGVLELTVYE